MQSHNKTAEAPKDGQDHVEFSTHPFARCGHCLQYGTIFPVSLEWEANGGMLLPAFGWDKSSAGWWKKYWETTGFATAALSSLLLCPAFLLSASPIGFVVWGSVAPALNEKRVLCLWYLALPGPQANAFHLDNSQ